MIKLQTIGDFIVNIFYFVSDIKSQYYWQSVDSSDTVSTNILKWPKYGLSASKDISFGRPN